MTNKYDYPQSFGCSYLSKKDIEKIKEVSGEDVLSYLYKDIKKYVNGEEQLSFTDYDKYRLIFWFDN